ncbi:MAG: hypothetical protein U1F24_16370 [Alphaproteobacteria bacterium]|jgi:hypothetical protein
MKSIVAGLSLLALTVPAHADIFARTANDSSTLVVGGLLAAVAALVVYRSGAKRAV